MGQILHLAYYPQNWNSNTNGIKNEGCSNKYTTGPQDTTYLCYLRWRRPTMQGSTSMHSINRTSNERKSGDISPDQ
ncbi:hypothetical protein DsansV1_C26g0193551 [Dioscorea sansibarensis]